MIYRGDFMYDNQQVLNDIVKASQIGIGGITAVVDLVTQPQLRVALKRQRHEYTKIQQEARKLAANMGLRVRTLPPLQVGMSAMAARGQLMFSRKNSRIAGMMIQGNTRGMIQSLTNMRRCAAPDPAVAELAQRMLETERRNIAKMQGFL